MQRLPKLSSVRGTAGEMSPGHEAPCLGELGNAFFRGKMDRFGTVEVLRWGRTVDGMERLCSLLLAISSPWIMLDSEVYQQVPCGHPASVIEAQATSGVPAGCPTSRWPPLGACGSGVSVCQQMSRPSPPGSVNAGVQAGIRRLCTGGMAPATSIATAGRSLHLVLPCAQPPAASSSPSPDLS